MRLPTHSIRLRLLLPLLVAAVPALALAVHAGFASQKAAVEQAYGESLRITRLVVRDHEAVLEETRRLLTLLAADTTLMTAEADVCSRGLSRWVQAHPLYANLGVVGVDGLLWCSALAFDEPMDLGDRAYFQEAIRTGGFAVGNYQVGRVTGKATVNAAQPVRDATGTLAGVVFAAVDLESLESVVRRIGLPAGAAFMAVDRNGTVLARYPDGANWVGRRLPEVQSVAALSGVGSEGQAEASGVDGVTRLFSMVPLATSAGGVAVGVGYPRAAVEAQARRQLIQHLLLLAVATLVALGVGWYLAGRWVVEPVLGITAATRDLAAGDLNARTNGGAGGQSNDSEIGDLAQAFDSMAEHVQREVDRRTAELKAANQRLQDMDVLKTKFVSDVTHELRSPVANLRFYMDLLGRGKPEKVERYMQRLIEQAERLENLIDAILELSKIDTPHLPVPMDAVDLNDLVGKTVAGFEPRFSSLGLRLEMDLDYSVPPVAGNPAQLRQVVANLVANALRYTPEGEVRVATRAVPDGVALEVSDTGIGIDPDDVPHLFERFYRGATAVAGEIPGTGLGLSIVREVVEGHRGSLAVESRPGQGSTFTVRLIPALNSPPA